MEIHPIAYYHSIFTSNFGIPRQSGIIPDLKGQIVFEPEYRNDNYIRGLEDYDYLWLIWEFSANKHKAVGATVRPPRLGGNKRMGVFATRSPYRPNPLGLSSVKIHSFEHSASYGTVIHVLGGDLKANTPIYDINVTKAEYPQIKVKETPTPQPKRQKEKEQTSTPANKEENIVTNQGDQLCQDLTTVLDQIINTNVEFKKRIAMKNALLDFFTPDAMVKVWGGDTKIVIDKYPISDYLGIISTSKKFYKIVAMQTDCDSDAKIQTLYVREYIKKD